jgi:peptide/nickel transport system substrate-binding protein
MAAMWKACSGENTKFNCAAHDGYDQIASVKAGTDKFDAIVTFKSSYPDWTQPFTGVVKAESIKDPDTFNKGWSELKNDWLSGPYKVDSYDKTQKVLTEVPNDKWWGAKPLLDKIVFRTIASSEWPKAFANNEIDAFDIGPNPDGFKTASTVGDATIRKAAGPNFRHITFNTKAGLLQDLGIRQAIVRGLDRTAIGASDLAGIDWPVRPLNNHILLENQVGYVDTAKATGLDYDPEKAKGDLDAAGWKAGADGIREKDGKKLEIKFTQIADTPVSENEALQIQNQLKDIGIKIDIVTSPSDKFFTSIAAHEFEMTAFTWVGTPYPYLFISQIYGTGSSSNYAQLSLPDVDKLAVQLKQEADQAKRNDLAAQTDKLIWENVHTLPLYQRPELVAVKSKLANYGAFGLSHNAFKWEDVGYQK